MGRRRQAAFLTTTGVTLVASLTACGNPITANHDWRALTASVTVVEHQGASTVNGTVLFGRLVDAQGRPDLNTIFQETCARQTTIGTSKTQSKCLAIINTGPKAYVAAGMTDNPYGKLTSLSGGSAPGFISITKLPGSPSTAKTFLIKISAIKG